MATRAVTDATFSQDVLLAEGDVLVDFWAQWCKPCLQVAPVLEEISDARAGSLTVLKLDVEANPANQMKYGVMTIPTMIVFRGGEVQGTIHGWKSKQKLLADLDAILAR